MRIRIPDTAPAGHLRAPAGSEREHTAYRQVAVLGLATAKQLGLAANRRPAAFGVIANKLGLIGHEESVRLTSAPADPDGYVTSVTYRRSTGGGSWATVGVSTDAGSGFALDVVPGEGRHVFTAVATDNEGGATNASQSGEVVGNMGPAVPQLVTPIVGHKTATGVDVSMTASATHLNAADGGALTHMIYQTSPDGVSWTDFRSSAAQGSWSATRSWLLTLGTQYIRAVARDSYGRTSAGAARAIQTVVPLGSHDARADGAFTVPAGVDELRFIVVGGGVWGGGAGRFKIYPAIGALAGVGGNAGDMAEGTLTVTPGEQLSLVVPDSTHKAFAGPTYVANLPNGSTTKYDPVGSGVIPFTWPTVIQRGASKLVSASCGRQTLSAHSITLQGLVRWEYDSIPADQGVSSRGNSWVSQNDYATLYRGDFPRTFGPPGTTLTKTPAPTWLAWSPGDYTFKDSGDATHPARSGQKSYGAPAHYLDWGAGGDGSKLAAYQIPATPYYPIVGDTPHTAGTVGGVHLEWGEELTAT